MKKILPFIAFALVGMAYPNTSFGVIVLESVQWNPPVGTPPVSSGSGTWLGGETVNLSTTAANNAGTVFNWNWSTMPFAAGYSLTATNNTGVAIGVGANSTATQTVTFSSSINAPYLFFNFIDPNTSFNFGSYNWTFLAGNKASRSGNSVISTGLNEPDAGFLVLINESFGPGTPLSFGYTLSGASPSSSAGFTVATPVSTPVPEPGTWAAAALLVGAAGYVRWRKRRSSEESSPLA